MWTFSSILHHKISLCQRDLECTRGKNQLGINKILHGCLLLQSGRNPCIMMTIFKSVECIVYRGTKSAVFNGNIFFLLESDTFIATQRLQSKLQFLLKTSLFYWQKCLNRHFSLIDTFFMPLSKYNENCSLCFQQKKATKKHPKLSSQTNKHCHSLHNQTDKFDPNLSLTKPFVTWPQEGWTREKISPISPSLGRCQQGSLCEQSHLECFKCLGAHTDLPDVPEFNTLVNSSVTIHHYSFEIKK